MSEHIQVIKPCPDCGELDHKFWCGQGFSCSTYSHDDHVGATVIELTEETSVQMPPNQVVHASEDMIYHRWISDWIKREDA